MDKEISKSSKLKEDILTLLFQEVHNRPAIWRKSHGDFKRFKTLGKNDRKDIEVVKQAHGLEKLEAVNFGQH